jgi:hypothetical protein
MCHQHRRGGAWKQEARAPSRFRGAGALGYIPPHHASRDHRHRSRLGRCGDRRAHDGAQRPRGAARRGRARLSCGAAPRRSARRHAQLDHPARLGLSSRPHAGAGALRFSSRQGGRRLLRGEHLHRAARPGLRLRRVGRARPPRVELRALLASLQAPRARSRHPGRAPRHERPHPHSPPPAERARALASGLPRRLSRSASPRAPITTALDPRVTARTR